MADPVFQSKLRIDFEAFIIQKRAVGYPYVVKRQILSGANDRLFSGVST